MHEQRPSASLVPDRLSIVIVNYNTREPLRRCLGSIQAHHSGLDLEVIVVDNASQDGSADMAREVMPEAVVIEPGRNTWFSGGNNIGAWKASGEYLLILNPDTVFQPGTLPTMLNYLRSHPDVGLVTCQMRFPDGSFQRTCSRLPQYVDLLLDYTLLGFIRPLRNRRHDYMFYADWNRESSRPVEVAPGSNLMLRSATMRQINGFDEALKLYFTEDDLCRRILQTGCEIHFIAEALLIHEERASVNQVRRTASQIYFDDLLIYARKYFGSTRAALLQIMIFPMRRAMDIAQWLRSKR